MLVCFTQGGGLFFFFFISEYLKVIYVTLFTAMSFSCLIKLGNDFNLPYLVEIYKTTE